MTAVIWFDLGLVIGALMGVWACNRIVKKAKERLTWDVKAAAQNVKSGSKYFKGWRKNVRKESENGSNLTEIREVLSQITWIKSQIERNFTPNEVLELTQKEGHILYNLDRARVWLSKIEGVN